VPQAAGFNEELLVAGAAKKNYSFARIEGAADAPALSSVLPELQAKNRPFVLVYRLPASSPPSFGDASLQPASFTPDFPSP
jgi:hypothetical protein